MLIKVNDTFGIKVLMHDNWILSNSFDVPYLGPYIYKILILNNLKESTKKTHLRNIGYFYDFIEKNFNIHGDKIIFTTDVNFGFKCFQAFFMHLDNAFLDNEDKKYAIWVSATDYWEKISFLRQQHYNSKDLEKLKDSFNKIQELLSYLKNPKPKKTYKIRDIGQDSISILDHNLDPSSELNPFKNLKAKWTYYIAYLILSMVGVRRGEVLNLCLNDIKTGEFFDDKEKIFIRKDWINIVEHKDCYDTRYSKPNIKNNNSIRQIPITEELYQLIHIYIEGYRPKTTSPFLLISLQGKPLSPESLNKNFKKIYQSLPFNLKQKLVDMNKLKNLTPHNLRHTSATSDLKHLIELYPEEHCFQIMRIIYGWGEKSSMPQYYAKQGYLNKYQDRIDEFNTARIKDIKEVVDHEKN